MAVGAPLVDRPQASQREVAAFVNPALGPLGNIDQKTIDYALKLQQEKAKSGSHSAGFELAKASLENKAKKWAGGRGKEAQAAFRDVKISEQVKNQVDKINVTKHGLELANLDPTRQLNRLDELKKLGLVDKTADAGTLVHDACATIANSQMFDVLFPDLVSLSPLDKAVWVSEGLAKNPALGDKISTLMGSWQEGVNSFPGIVTTQGEQRKQDINNAKLKQQNAYDNMDSVITKNLKINKSSIKPLQRGALDTAMATGDKPAILNILVELKGITPAELTTINEYNVNKQLLADYRAKKATVSKAEQTRVKLLVEGNPPTVPVPTIPKMTEFNDITSTLESATFSTNLDTYKQQSETIDNVLLQKLPRNDQEELSELTRKDQEQSSLSDLENVLDRAMLQAYESIESDMVDAKVAVEKQKIADATKAGRMDEAKMYTERAKRWIEKKGPGLPEEVHLANIREDLNITREYGKIGIRLIIARDAGLITPKQFDAVVQHTTSAHLTLAKMDEGAIQQLDNLANKEGVMEDYRDTMMKDYLRANKYIKQTSLGRLISYGIGKNKTIQLDADQLLGKDFATRAKFALRPNEWEDLYGHFDEDIRTAIDKNKDAQSFLNKLKSEGVVSEPKLRRLLYMLALMGMVAIPGLGIGGLGGLAGGAALGIPGIGAATGAVAGLGAAEAAAIGVGNATKNDLIQ